jgi:hypothetical protein
MAALRLVEDIAKVLCLGDLPKIGFSNIHRVGHTEHLPRRAAR